MKEINKYIYVYKIKDWIILTCPQFIPAVIQSNLVLALVTDNLTDDVQAQRV